MDKDDVVARIQSQLADADIRSDQCDIVRVYWRGRFSFIKEVEDSGIEVSVETSQRGRNPFFN
jgi:hypothetical protein